MRIRLAITTTLMVALAVAWLVPFTCILLYGTHTVQEPSKVILGIEVFFFLAIVTYGIHCLLFLVSSWRKQLHDRLEEKG